MKSKRSLAVLSAATLFVIAIVLLWIMYLQKKLDMDNTFFNSDTLYLAEVYRDVILNGGKLSDWYLTPAPSFVPDWIFYAIARLFSSNWFTAWPKLFTQQLLATLIGSYFVLRVFVDRNRAWLWALLGTSWITLLSALEIEPFRNSLYTVYHFGSFIAFLVSLTLILRLYEAPRSRSLQIATALVILVTTGCDRLFLVHFVLPLIGIVGLAYILKLFTDDERKRIRLVSLLCLGSAIAGILLYEVMIPHHTMYEGKLSIKKVAYNFHQIGVNVGDIFSNNPFTFLIILLFYVFAGRITINWLRYRKASRPLTTLDFALIYLFASAVTTVLVLTLMGTVDFVPRYWIPLVLLPLVLIPLIQPAAWRGFARFHIVEALFLIGLLVSTATVSRKVFAEPHIYYDDHYPLFVACMDELARKHDVRVGIAPYWDAKPLRLLSREKIDVANFRMEAGEVKPFNWIASVGWLKESYQFIVIAMHFPEGSSDRFDESKIIEKNGPPEAEEWCDRRKILIYKAKGLRF